MHVYQLFCSKEQIYFYTVPKKRREDGTAVRQDAELDRNRRKDKNGKD